MKPALEPADTVLQEIHETRRRLLQEHGGIHGLADFLRAQEAKAKWEVSEPGGTAATDRKMFIGYMNTPILKASKGNVELEFYNEGEYNEWTEATNTKAWKIKYYKGLGTSTGKEFREYFEKMKTVVFNHTEKSDDSIDMVFNKKRAMYYCSLSLFILSINSCSVSFLIFSVSVLFFLSIIIYSRAQHI